MINNVTELAENKLVILYILDKIDVPISNSHITQVVLENNLINYFSLQQYISELVQGDLVKNYKKDNSTILELTTRGRDALRFFCERIPEKKKHIVDTYLDINIKNINKQIEAVGDYEVENNKFISNLKLQKNDDILLQIKMPAPSEKKAKEICSIWNENYEEIYDTMIKIFQK